MGHSCPHYRQCIKIDCSTENTLGHQDITYLVISAYTVTNYHKQNSTNQKIECLESSKQVLKQ